MLYPLSYGHSGACVPAGVADGCRTRAFGSTIRRSAVELRPPRAGFLRWAGGNDPPRPRGVAFVHPGEASRPAGPVLHHPHPSSAFIVLPFPWMPKTESPRPASCAGGATCIAPLVRNRAPTARPLRSPRRRTSRSAGHSRFRTQYRTCPALPWPNDDPRSSDWRTTLPAPARPGGPRGGCSWTGRRTGSSRLRSPVHGGWRSAGHQQKKSRVLMPPVHATWSGGRPSALRKGWRSSGRDSQGR